MVTNNEKVLDKIQKLMYEDLAEIDKFIGIEELRKMIKEADDESCMMGLIIYGDSTCVTIPKKVAKKHNISNYSTVLIEATVEIDSDEFS